MKQTRRTLIVAGLVIVAVAAIVVWRFRQPDGTTTSSTSVEKTTAAPVFPLGLRMRIAVGDPAANAMLTLTLFNRASRQAAIDRAVVSGRAGRPAAPAPASVRVDFPAADWLSRIQIDELRADGTRSRINGVTIRLAPPAISLEGDATAEVILECPATSLPAAGARLVARFRSESGPIESDPAEVPAPAPASTNVLTAALADARVARISKDTDRLARAAAIIEKEAPQSVDAPYYRGLVQEARGERVAALASYKEALARFGRGQNSEPPDELIFLIRRLQGGGK